MVVIVSIVMWLIFAVLIFRAKKEPGDMLQRVSMYLYKRWNMSGGFVQVLKKKDTQIQQNLVSLHPGGAPVELLTAYYTEKIRLVMLILLVGSGIACCVEIAGGTRDTLVSNGVLSRPAEEQSITLQAAVKDAEGAFKEKITLDVGERVWRPDEAEEQYRELIVQLDQTFLGENVSQQEVRRNLELPYEMEGFPFVIEWKSSRPSLLDRNGVVHTEDLELPEEVVLTAEVYYGENAWEHSWKLVLYPPLRTAREQFLYDLKRLSEEAEAGQQYEDKVELPLTVNGRKVSWKPEKDSTGIVILLVAFAAAVTVYCVKDNDLQGELIKRREKMKLEYPTMVSKYALFLEAGMTVRGAFLKICGDYYAKEPGEVHPLYEEMHYSCNELRAGISESKVYENFGRRTGVQEYTRLCTLLSQNLKKGNTALARRLKEESDAALRENLQLRKRQGEEAETKMLVPMGMMLIMVLVMIMLPAFSGLGI